MEHVRFGIPFQNPFYTPHLLAIALGCFRDEGLDVEQVSVDPGALTRALLGSEVDVGLSGPMRALGAADRGEGRLLCVAEVNSRVGFFLLGRASGREFDWRDLVGRRVFVFAEAPTPRLCLEYLLERHGVGPSQVELLSDLPTERAVPAFLDGAADYLLQGQPVTERLLAGGQAQLAVALGPALGPLAFSAYLVTPRLLGERPGVLDAALRALYRAQRWLHAHPAEEIAAEVAWAFPELEGSLLVAAIRRYLATRTWAADPVLRRRGFDALQEVLLLRGFVRRSHPYEALVDRERAEAAVRAVDGVP